jgi:hypothetical protein
MSKQRKATNPHAADMVWTALEVLAARVEGQITTRLVVDEARNPDNPLHDRFEWDDEVCGESYRLMQAGQLLRQWKGSIVKQDPVTKAVDIKTTRRVQSTGTQRKEAGGGYETVERIMADPEKRADMIRTVLRELGAYRKRYADIAALSDIWAAIDEAIELHGGGRSKATGDEERPTT